MTGLLTRKIVCLFSGDKQYILGDQPSDVDCAVFSVLAQFKYHHANGRLKLYLEGNYYNMLNVFLLSVTNIVMYKTIYLIWYVIIQTSV